MAQTGDEIILYRPGSRPERLAEYPDLPIVFACVVFRYQGEILFVFNTWRKLWELPAGLIEQGESPLEAGIRELREETNQIVSSLTYTGMVLLRLKRDGRLELGAMFTCELATVQPFTPNDEISAIMLWDLKRSITGEVDILSCKLVELMNL